MLISFALDPVFQWNMGFKLLKVYFCAVQVQRLYECIAADVWPRGRPISEFITHIGSASSQTPHLPIILHYSSSPLASLLRDRSSITGRRGVGTKLENGGSESFYATPLTAG